MVLPAQACATWTGRGPMLQPSPSVCTYSMRVVSGKLSPIWIMRVSWRGLVEEACCIAKPQKENDPHCGSFPFSLQRGGCRGLDQRGLFDQTGRNPVLGLGQRAAFGDLDHFTEH